MWGGGAVGVNKRESTRPGSRYASTLHQAAGTLPPCKLQQPCFHLQSAHRFRRFRRRSTDAQPGQKAGINTCNKGDQKRDSCAAHLHRRLKRLLLLARHLGSVRRLARALLGALAAHSRHLRLVLLQAKGEGGRERAEMLPAGHPGQVQERLVTCAGVGAQHSRGLVSLRNNRGAVICPAVMEGTQRRAPLCWPLDAGFCSLLRPCSMQAAAVLHPCSPQQRSFAS